MWLHNGGLIASAAPEPAATYQVIEGFEGAGLPSDWTVIDSDATIDADNTSRFLFGSESLRVKEDSGTGSVDVIEWAPQELAGGGNPDYTIIYYNEESTDAFGFGWLFRDSNGDDVGAFLSNNPQWVYYDANGFTKNDSSLSSTNEWFKIRIDFDWVNYEFDINAERVSDGSTFNIVIGAIMRVQTNIEKFVVPKFNSFDSASNYSFSSDGKVDVWLDNVEVTKQ
jgi:hypothetical protein